MLLWARDALNTNAAVAGFLHEAGDRGVVAATELEALQLEHELDDDTLDEVRAALAAAEVEIEEAGDAGEAPRRSRPAPCPAWSPTACSSS